MPVTAVVGLQWGDEAKGKFVDLLSPNADLVARFNGGDNAGHTVINEFGTFKLRLMPNGFSNSKTICAIGPGVVVNPQTLIDEIETIQTSGIELESRLWVSPRCNLVLPYHRLLEGAYEEARGASKTGTTRRGIGPVFADKVSYNGIRFFDLKREDQFARKLRLQLSIKNPVLDAFGVEPLEFEALFREISDQYSRLKPYIREPFGLAQQMLADGDEILLEGAQGALLDNNWGTYPYCTASITLAGGACAGFGIAPHAIQRVVGVTKAYTTRVGAGPMPTELVDETGERIQQAGHEFGTVTGRARRCGWFDAELVRFTCQLNGVTELALTKLDVLDGLPKLKICNGYRLAEADERLSRYWEMDAEELELCEPVYLELEGWQQPTVAARSFDQLPRQAQSYVRKVEELVGVPVKFISVGPEREATIAV